MRICFFYRLEVGKTSYEYIKSFIRYLKAIDNISKIKINQLLVLMNTLIISTFSCTFEQFKNDKDVKKDIDLLVSQVDRCNEILKRLTLNPIVEDEFIDKDLSLHDYVKEIVTSFQEISDKNFDIDIEQNANSFNVTKSIEIVYGIRNFIGNANKYAKNNIYIAIKSDSEVSEITIEDDGPGFPKDIIAKLGEPYIKSRSLELNSNSGLGLGTFLGKTLLERQNAKLLFKEDKNLGGASVVISWSPKNILITA